MTRHLACLLGATLIALGTPAPGAAQQTPFRAVATVNDRVITAFDLEQRMRLMRLLGAQAASEEAMRRVALQELIEDRLKLEAGGEIGLRPSAESLAEGRNEIAERLDLAPGELDALLANQGVSAQAMDDFVGANIVWRRLVRARFSGRIEPGDAEIDGEIALALGTDSVDYRLQEIGLPMNGDGRTPAETQALGERLRAEIGSTEAFADAARRYSRASTAEAGGEIGWVSGATLPPALAEQLAPAEPGAIVALQVPGGLSLVRLVDRRRTGPAEIDADDPALRARMRERIVEDQGARLAEGLLQELRRDAIVEIR